MFAGLKIIKLILDSLFNVRSDGSNQSSIYGQTTSTQLGTIDIRFVMHLQLKVLINDEELYFNHWNKNLPLTRTITHGLVIDILIQNTNVYLSKFFLIIIATS